MPRGGARKRAGRIPGTGQYGERTVVMRVPASMVEAIKKFIAEGDEPTCPLISLKGSRRGAGHKPMEENVK